MARFSVQDLKSHAHALKAGDIVIGEFPAAHQAVARLVDLMQCGVAIVPSPLAQILSRSKVAQVEILGEFMLPLTLAIRRRKQLLDAIGVYTEAGVGAVVTKEEHMHCGHGVRRWDQIETLYSFQGLDKSCYPFILQPLAADFLDVRVIIVGDYTEAYARRNTHNFRGNLSTGGDCTAHELLPAQDQFCRQVMARAGFPYAHLDLQIMPDGRLHLLEIALNGGIHGSRLKRTELDRRKAALLDQIAERLSQRSDK